MVKYWENKTISANQKFCGRWKPGIFHKILYKNRSIWNVSRNVSQDKTNHFLFRQSILYSLFALNQNFYSSTLIFHKPQKTVQIIKTSYALVGGSLCQTIQHTSTHTSACKSVKTPGGNNLHNAAKQSRKKNIW